MASTTVFSLLDQGECKQVRAVMTCGAGNATFTATMIPYNMRGMHLHSVRYTFSATVPVTDNSDLTLNEHSTAGVDILGGGGTNNLDIAGNTLFAPLIGTTVVTAPVFGDLYITPTGNSVNAAIVTLDFNFIRI